MALKYVVTKRVFGFDKTNTENTDWLAGLRHAEKIGLGTMDYELIKI